MAQGGKSPIRERRASLRGGEGNAGCQSSGRLRRMSKWSSDTGPMWGAGPERVWGTATRAAVVMAIKM